MPRHVNPRWRCFSSPFCAGCMSGLLAFCCLFPSACVALIARFRGCVCACSCTTRNDDNIKHTPLPDEDMDVNLDDDYDEADDAADQLVVIEPGQQILSMK